MPQSKKFILQQVVALTKLGVPAQDIERTIKFVEEHLPAGEDAATWVPTAADLAEGGVLSAEALLDARVAWYGDKSVPRRFKRLLDAMGDG